MLVNPNRAFSFSLGISEPPEILYALSLGMVNRSWCEPVDSDTEGDKRHTKVFAGGAHIATQDANATTSTGDDRILFTSADPVTGTKLTFDYTDGTEPLGGQQIERNDPGTGYPTDHSQVLGTPRDPEWQCVASSLKNDLFKDMPVHCQKAVSERSVVVDGASIREANPNKITAVDSPLQSTPGTAEDSPSSVVLASASRATSKSSSEGEGGCDWDKDGTDDCATTVKNPGPALIDPISAEQGLSETTVINLQTGPESLNADENKKLDRRIAKIETKLKSERCKEFLTDKLGLDGLSKLVETLKDQSLRFSARRSKDITVEDAGVYGSNARAAINAELKTARGQRKRDLEIIRGELPLSVREWVYLPKNRGISAFVAANRAVYYVDFNSVTTILHENLHVSTGLGDVALAARLGLGTFASSREASPKISEILQQKGCT